MRVLVHAFRRTGLTVKCDEAQPSCMTCRLYGVSCDYSGVGSSLDLAAQGSFQVDLTSGASDEIAFDSWNAGQVLSKCTHPLESISIHSSLTTLIDNSLCSDTWSLGLMNRTQHFSEGQLEIITRFRDRTSATIGNPRMAPQYRDLVCQLACKHAFLMHMLLSITLMHDAHLEDPSAASLGTRSSQKALEHWNTASELFNKILSRPIPPDYRDAIWATGVFLGAASFWSLGSTNPLEVWPLKPSEPDDLAWLKVGEGKKHLWRLAQPKRMDSIFCELVKDNNCLTVPEWMAMGPELPIADRIKEILNITDSSDESNNVYYQPVAILSKCPNVRLTHDNAMKFLYILAVITPEFFGLLEAKDVRALFIMGWWYILLTTGDLWWMSRRARIEGQAIRIWLRRQRGGGELASLLDEIEKRSGMDEEVATWFFQV